MKPITRKSRHDTAFNAAAKKGYYPGSKPFLKRKIKRLRRRLERKHIPD